MQKSELLAIVLSHLPLGSMLNHPLGKRIKLSFQEHAKEV